MSNQARVGASWGWVDAPDLSDLRPYQVEAVHWLRAQQFALLADEMGLGKTVEILRALKRQDRVILICPASVIMVWVKECAKWRPDLTVTVDDEMRRPDPGEILIMSYDSMPDPSQGSRVLVRCDMTGVTVIFDECHALKTWSAQRTQKARRLAHQVDRVWGASGSPMLNDPDDLWGVLVSLRIDWVFHDTNYTDLWNGKPRFITRNGQLKRIGTIWGHAKPEVAERLSKVMLRRRTLDVLTELPEKRYLDVPVPAPESLVPYLDEIKEAWDRIGPNDLPPFELISEARKALARSRIPAAVSFMATALEQVPWLIFSAHVEPIEAVGRIKGIGAFTGATPERERRRLVDAFMSGELQGLAMTIDSGGVGLNLQRAGAVLFIDRDYTPAMNLQAEARAWRMGQQNQSVLIARMVSDHPLDVRLDEILSEKQRLIREAGL